MFQRKQKNGSINATAVVILYSLRPRVICGIRHISKS
nr:MAG TPA: hypothetical protein [Caudoviricetes sp.]